jgi:hypothetical protein
MFNLYLVYFVVGKIDVLLAVVSLGGLLFVSIYTLILNYPGMLIGAKGENINSLTRCISNVLNRKIEIIVREDMVDEYVLPYDYSNIGEF